MSERIVVCCRMDHARLVPPAGGDARGYLEHARALKQQAEALGASLASWSATTLGFAFDTNDLEEAIAFVKELRDESPTWACGLAQGEMEPLADKGSGRADLAWGEPLVAAVALARVALAGEVLVDGSVKALKARELLTLGRRLAVDGGRRVRAWRLDVDQPWRTDAALSVRRVEVAKLVGRPDPMAILGPPGTVNLVRADPGFGGTRMLNEIAARIAPAPCILVMPSGASVEPLGALRRALVRALTTLPYPNDPELGPQLDMFLGGIGASIEVASAIVSALLKPVEPNAPPGALLIDDAGEVDAESLEACAQLVTWADPPLHVVLRVDATDVVPGAFANLQRGGEIDLEPLGQAEGEELARSLTGEALQPVIAKRWARRGSFTPLGIVEAVQHGLTTGEIAWVGERAYARTRVAGRGKPRPASYWIGRRAKRTAPDERGVLATVALFGGEVSIENAELALHAVDAPIVVKDQATKLIAARWLTETQPGWVALPTRTHRDTIAELLDEEPRRALHKAIAEVLEHSEGELGCAEAAHHAAKAGDGERAARLALRAARAASAAGMTKSANRLLTLARLADPKCEPLTRRALISSLPPPGVGAKPVVVPPPPSVARSVEGRPAAPPSAPRTAPEKGSAERAAAPASAQAAAVVREGDEPDSVPTLVKPGSKPAHAPLPEPIPVPAPAEGARERTMLGVAPAPPHAPPPVPPPLPRQTRQMPAVHPTLQSMPASGRAPQAAPRPPAPPPAPSQATAAAPPPAHGIPPPLPARASVSAMSAVRPPAQGPASRATAAATLPTKPAMPAPRPSTLAMAAARPPPVPTAPLQTPAQARGAEASVDDRTLVGAPAEVAGSAPRARAADAKADEALDGVAGRLTQLAKAALLGGDAGALERWSEGLRATGEHERFAERMEAMARLSRGHVGDALRVLRKARDDVGDANLAARTQASLALGVALAAAGRPEEALLEGLDALARAREKKDPKGSHACLAFLSKLFASQNKGDAAAALRDAAKA